MTTTVRDSTSAVGLAVSVLEGVAAQRDRPEWQALRQACGAGSPSWLPAWLRILRRGLGHRSYAVEAKRGDAVVGWMPLSLVESRLFGRFLVSQPYLNLGGALAVDEGAAAALIDVAVSLADDLDVDYLELRHEERRRHPALCVESSHKVHMRLPLAANADEQWKVLKAKVRNQVRKGEQHDLRVAWGGPELLGDFYRVFCINMRDLGTPVFSRRLFAAILSELAGRAELCVIRRKRTPIAAAMLVHGDGVTEVPSASSLRRWNSTNANMLMYWHLLRRSIERGQTTFDFGRSTIDGPTYRFKAQWGAQPHGAVWQYFVRRGSVGDLRPDSPAMQRRIALWKRLPVWVTELIGPPIVRGIP